MGTLSREPARKESVLARVDVLEVSWWTFDVRAIGKVSVEGGMGDIDACNLVNCCCTIDISFLEFCNPYKTEIKRSFESMEAGDGGIDAPTGLARSMSVFS